MRSIWRGAINFGMVTIPVKLYAATEQKDVRFRLLHREDGAPIEEKRFCTADGEEVGWDELVRGFEISKGEFVVLEPEEIEQVAPETTRTVEIGDFVELEEIDPIYFEKSYFLEPTDVGAKPFNLLRPGARRDGSRGRGARGYSSEGEVGDVARVRRDAGARDDVLAR